jgi:hypothetical protein
MSPFTKDTTWKPTHPSEPHGRLSAAQLNALPDSAFAFPRSRKEPIIDAAHVRSALARFNQVSDVSDADRDLAFANIRRAAEHFGIDMHETDWRQLGETSRSS